ncbi:MAG: hypothetical protein JXQ30_12160 [Spirochaetes bacterium]|nr:hypothetical protein [Spirochaetota bacterium]
MAAAGFVLHRYCHKVHKQAHERSQKIEGIVTTGLFATIRYPMYLSLIVMFLGLAVVWGIIWMFAPALFFSAITVLIAMGKRNFCCNGSTMSTVNIYAGYGGG